MFLIIILYALFGATFSLGKVLVSYSQPILLVGIRMTIAGFILLGYQFFNKDTTFKLTKKDWWLYTQIILFTTYFPYILRFWAFQYMSSSKASLLYSLSPFMTYLFSYWLSNEKITQRKIIGLLIGFLGFLPVLIIPVCTTEGAQALGCFSWPEVAIILSVTSLSYGWIVVRKLLRENNYSAGMVNGISMSCGGLLALVTSLCVETHQPIVNIGEFVKILTVVIIVSNLICHNLYTGLLKRYTPTLLAFAGFLTPMFTAFYSWLFLQETLSWPFFVSLIGVLCGLTIFYHDELKTATIDHLEHDMEKAI